MLDWTHLVFKVGCSCRLTSEGDFCAFLPVKQCLSNMTLATFIGIDVSDDMKSRDFHVG